MLFTATTADVGLRLDVFLSKQLPETSRARIQNWLQASNQKASKTIKLPGEVIEVQIPENKPSHLEPQNLPLEIVYADDDLIVINKPAGLVVHPGAGNPDKTLVNALLHHFPDIHIGDTERPGIVHRLDKNTSGLMVIARNDKSHQSLSLAFKNHEVKKVYRAICIGGFNKISFELKTGHKRHPTSRKRFTTKQVTTRIAHSRFEVISTANNRSELRVEIFTGRTHQIRAQLSDLGHPLLGDTLYGGPAIPGFDRHALHAEELAFKHPTKQEPMTFHVAADFCLTKL